MNTLNKQKRQRPHIENSNKYADGVKHSDIVDVLIQAREDRGLSQAALARKLDMSRQGLHNWESKRRQTNLDDLIRWAAALGLELDVTLSRRGLSAHGRATTQLAALDEPSAQIVLALTALLGQMDARDRFAVESYVESLQRNYERVLKTGTQT